MVEPSGLRVLLTESLSNSAREMVTVLSRRGHSVGVVEPSRGGALTVSRRVRWRHKVPAFGKDPLGYLDALRDVLSTREYDVVLPIHEQVAVLSRYPDALAELGVPFAAPPFDSFARVQDKAAAAQLLTELGVPLPPTELVSDLAALRAAASEPCYVKLPISTGSKGVWFVDGPEALDRVAEHPLVSDAFARGWSVLVQRPVTGRFVMMQAVFDHGVLVAGHTVLRVREGVQGSASAKESVVLPALTQHVEKLGAELSWHGALSVDAIVDDDETAYLIDLNPRLVEPVNAELAGADLVGRLLAVSRGESPPPAPAGQTGVRTHMALLAILRHGELGHRRRDIAAELRDFVLRRGHYKDSVEELLPIAFDPPAVMPLLIVGSQLLINPKKWRQISGTSAPSTVLSPFAWELLTASD